MLPGLLLFWPLTLCACRGALFSSLLLMSRQRPALLVAMPYSPPVSLFSRGRVWSLSRSRHALNTSRAPMSCLQLCIDMIGGIIEGRLRISLAKQDFFYRLVQLRMDSAGMRAEVVGVTIGCSVKE